MAGNHNHRSAALATAARLHRVLDFGEPQPLPLGELLPGGCNWSRSEVLKYGDLAQAAYEAFDGREWSPYYGTSLYGLRRMLPAVGVAGHGYVATSFIYATVDLFPERLEPLLKAEKSDDHAYWIGYVAVAGDAEAERVGCRDIAVVWRGTVVPGEWALNVRTGLVPFEVDGEKDDGARVAKGFYWLYTSKNAESAYGRRSAREQVAGELRRLVTYFRDVRGEEVRVTFTGHSLGGALALLAARDAASAALPAGGVAAVRAVTFGAPRVGTAFRGALASRGVAVLRVVVRGDVVPLLPRVPGANLLALALSPLLGKLPAALARRGWWAPSWVYVHAGDDEVVLDVSLSEHLKQSYDLGGFHNLEVCLHLVDGGAGAGRDVALVNKSSDMLKEDIPGRRRIPARWLQPRNKGLARDEHGMWVLEREHGDLPVPDDCLSFAELHGLPPETETAVMPVG